MCISHKKTAPVKEIKIQEIKETSPELRIQKYLIRKNYKEAEAFINLYNLDMNILRKAKAQDIIDKQICEPEDTDNLIKILADISDESFKLTSCLHFIKDCHSPIQEVKKILNYADSIIENTSKQVRSTIK